MCDDVVAIRENFGSNYVVTLFPGKPLEEFSGPTRIQVRFEAYRLEEQPPFVFMDAPGRIGGAVEARAMSVALARAADIIDAGWSAVTEIPTLEEHHATQAELALDLKEVAEARA